MKKRRQGDKFKCSCIKCVLLLEKKKMLHAIQQIIIGCGDKPKYCIDFHNLEIMFD